MRYGEVVRLAWEAGFSLANMGSLPHISVAGASATGTHGSGSGNRTLAAGVRAVEMMTADGDLTTFSREQDPDVFGGTVLSLGSLGIVTQLTVDLVPAFEVRQSVYLDLPGGGLAGEDRSTAGDGLGTAELLSLLDSAYSVSLFHQFDGGIDQVWVKQKVRETAAGGATGAAGAGAGVGPIPTDPTTPFPSELLGARLATSAVHPLPGMPADYCTDQTGTPGPAFERLPHFRMEFTPSNGEEIQSEYFVAREDLGPALAALNAVGEQIRPHLFVGEIRAIKADDLWLSPAYERDSVAFHFTWKREPEAVQAVLPRIEEALAHFAPRPHWGKVHTMDPATVRAQYPRLPDFLALRERLDPEGKFLNPYVERMLGIGHPPT
jgi:xylitol oxidase